jgi:hypothetical protein
MSIDDRPPADELEEIVARVLASDDSRAVLEQVCAERPADAARIRRTIGFLERFRMLAAGGATGGSERSPNTPTRRFATRETRPSETATRVCGRPVRSSDGLP